jgi:hypothetical protein
MLRQRFAAGRNRRDNLHIRMHVLPRLRGASPQGRLPELRRQFCTTADPAVFETVQKSADDAARLQSSRLRISARELSE